MDIWLWIMTTIIMPEKKLTRVERIQYYHPVILFILGFIIVLVCLFILGFIAGKPLEIWLIGTGLLVMTISLVLIYGSHLTVDKPFTVFDKVTVEIPQSNSVYNYVFPIKDSATIKGEINVETIMGPANFSIYEYFGQYLPSTKTEWYQKPYVSYRFLSGMGKVDFKEIDLESGNYYVHFETEKVGDFKAIINLIGVYHTKPYAWLREVGCTLLEIAIPLIATGLILFAGRSI